MSGRAWGIKLGSGGICVPFCEKHQIVGVGWKTLNTQVLRTSDWEWTREYISEAYQGENLSNQTIGAWAGQLFRFGRECQKDDYVLYYNPPKKQVCICRVTSGLQYRDFDLEDPADIWQYRKVEYACAPVPVLDLYGALKGKILGPRLSFWEIKDCYAIVHRIALGQSPHVEAAPDKDIQDAFSRLRELVVKRLEALNDNDWEWLVVDYFKAQGAEIDESEVGGSRPIIDVEARFSQGELGEETWRVQIKRLQGKKVDWPMIEEDSTKVGETKFCYVSAFGFTEEAERRAEEAGIRLLEAGDFVHFLITRKPRESLRVKLKLPF